jgi:hypothetical protein
MFFYRVVCPTVYANGFSIGKFCAVGKFSVTLTIPTTADETRSPCPTFETAVTLASSNKHVAIFMIDGKV